MSFKKFEIKICNDCYELKSEMCHEPECILCRRTIEEIKYILNALIIRPNIGKKEPLRL